MEFDKSKILTVVTADQAKVGQKGWFASNVETLSRLVLEEQPKELLGFNSNNAVHAFRTSFQNHALFYPAPEPTYAERQEEWVKENNVTIGTKVRITRAFSYSENDSDCGWVDLMSKTVGIEGFVTELDSGSIKVKTQYSSWWYPYFVLDVVKEPTYRPFKNAEEFKPFRDEWFMSKCDNSKSSSVKALSYSNLGVILLREVTKSEDVVFDLCKWDEFFQWFVRENGEPCGVREEA